jgi:hypothetical protein
MGKVHIAAVMVRHFGSCGKLAGCSWAWKDVRYVICSPSRGICRITVLLSSLYLLCSFLITHFLNVLCFLSQCT